MNRLCLEGSGRRIRKPVASQSGITLADSIRVSAKEIGGESDELSSHDHRPNIGGRTEKRKGGGGGEDHTLEQNNISRSCIE